MTLATVIKTLEVLEETAPLVSDHIAPILVDAIQRALREGVTDPDVWVRAFKAAAVYVEAQKIDDAWLNAATVYPRKPDASE